MSEELPEWQRLAKERVARNNERSRVLMAERYARQREALRAALAARERTNEHGATR